MSLSWLSNLNKFHLLELNISYIYITQNGINWRPLFLVYLFYNFNATDRILLYSCSKLNK